MTHLNQRELSLAATAAVACLAGCTTGYYESTVVGQLSFLRQGGLSAREFEPGHYLVEYEASLSNTYEMNRNFVMYKCASIALERGYETFQTDGDVRLTQAQRPRTKSVYGVYMRLVKTPVDPNAKHVHTAKVVEAELRPFIDKYR